ncbi:MAG: hypothetical protein N3D10_00950 [Candidatus Micrarchaeota archaeon]|nr:hypothetical protein [Candidatus Micrarchaeota archaeon]
MFDYYLWVKKPKRKRPDFHPSLFSFLAKEKKTASAQKLTNYF